MTGVLIDSALRAFLESGVSIVVASRDADNIPSLGRGYGCRVTGAMLTVLLCPQESAQLVADVAQTGAVAAVFSRPSTYQTYQIKGQDGRCLPPDPSLAAITDRYLPAFRGELAGIGVPMQLMSSLVAPAQYGDLVGLGFTATAIFQQTPGPGAGEPLGGS